MYTAYIKGRAVRRVRETIGVAAKFCNHTPLINKPRLFTTPLALRLKSSLAGRTLVFLHSSFPELTLWEAEGSWLVWLIWKA